MPDFKEEVRKRLAGLNLSPTRENEIVEELSIHLEERTCSQSWRNRCGRE
jgi:hypothetical protein